VLILIWVVSNISRDTYLEFIYHRIYVLIARFRGNVFPCLHRYRRQTFLFSLCLTLLPPNITVASRRCVLIYRHLYIMLRRRDAGVPGPHIALRMVVPCATSLCVTSPSFTSYPCFFHVQLSPIFAGYFIRTAFTMNDWQFW